MKLLSIVVVLIALFVAAFFLATGSERAPQGVSPAVPALLQDSEAGAEPASLEPSSPPLAESAEANRSELRSVGSPETDEEEAPPFDGPIARVVGSIVDQEGAPISATRVQLVGYRWPEGVEVPELRRLGWESFSGTSTGYETKTDEQGQFTVEAPFGDKAGYELRAAASRFHDSVRIRFGRDGEQPVVEGTVDVGEIRLAASGSIFGTVSSVRGEPIAEAVMGTGPERSTTYGHGSLSRADGSFVIPHARVGTYMVMARAEGYVSELAEDVTVKLGEDTGPIDLILKDASKLEARVVDEAGQPIEGVRFWGWPKSSGRGAGARSKADGSVVIYLPQDEPYTMQATHPDYEQWGVEHDKTRLFEPNTQLGTITLKQLPPIRFSAVDEANGEELTAFGIIIARDEGSESESSGTTFYSHPSVKEHPGGVLEKSAQPGRDACVAYAPGFLMKRVDVRPTEESVRAGEPAQTLRLSRGAGIKGRLIWEGEPVPAVPIEVMPGSKYRDQFTPDKQTSFTIKAGPDGRFETTGINSRVKVRLTARRPGSKTPLLVFLEPLKTGEVHDLGDLEFQEGGEIVGRVLLPPGLDPGGITVFRGDWREDRNTTTDSEGVFRFDAVPPGEVTLGQRGRPEVIEGGGSAKAVVTAGEVTSVEFDLRDQAMIDIELELRLDNAAMSGGSVTLLGEELPSGSSFVLTGRRSQVKLGDVGEGGVVRARTRPMEAAFVQVRLPHGASLEHVGAPLEIKYGPPFRASVTFEASTLVLELGESIELPEEGSLNVMCSGPTNQLGSGSFVGLPIVGGAIDPSMAPWATSENGEITVRGLRPGEWTVEVSAVKKGAPRVETELPSGATRYGPKAIFRVTQKLTLPKNGTQRMRVDS